MPTHETAVLPDDETLDEASIPHEIYGLPSTASPEFTELVAAISVDDAERVGELLGRNPDLVRQRLTLRSSLPLTLAAKDCSVAALQALMEGGADVAADENAALFRAVTGECAEAARLLLRHGADPNAVWPHYGSVLMAASECHALECLRLLLGSGADPNFRSSGEPAHRNPFLSTALGMAIGGECRSALHHQVVNTLIEAGAETEDSPVMDLHRGNLLSLARRLEADPALARQRFDLPYGLLPLKGATLLHVAADYGDLAAAEMLLHSGAEVNAQSGPNGDGPTPLFHAAVLPQDLAGPMLRLLLDRGAHPNARAMVFLESGPTELSPLGWAQVSGLASRGARQTLRRRGALE